LKIASGGRLLRGERDLVAVSLQALDEGAGDALRVELVEGVGARLDVVPLLLEQW
jgi:hypothetical protein